VAEIQKQADRAEQASTTKTGEAAKEGGVIFGQTNQDVHANAFEQAHTRDQTLSEPDMIAMEEGETVAEHKARVARIQANRFRFIDSEEGSGSAAETGTVIEYEHERIGNNLYAGGMDYEEGRDTRTIYEKLSDFGEVAAAMATDPEGQKAYIQGQIDKIIGIGEGLNIAKDSTKALVVAGWTALTDGTVASFLAKPNAINDPLFHAVGGAFHAMEKDPSAVNHALERVGTIVMEASEHYRAAPNIEKGHVIGETMFGMVNPEGSTEAGEAALKVADKVATHVDAAVMQGLGKSYKVVDEMAFATPELAQQAKQMLHDYTRSLGLSSQEMEIAGIPKGYFDGMQPRPGAGKGDNFFAMSKAKANDLGNDHQEGEINLRRKAGAGGDWPIINERLSPDVVCQTHRYSCVSAVGEMLSEGRVKQAELIEKLGAPGDLVPTQFLARHLGDDWIARAKDDADLDGLLKGGSWGAELRDLMGRRYARLEPAHTVVVDGLDDAGNIMVRDPAHGTRYEMTQKNFLKHWTGIAVYRK
jgi:filamentous hemagglutinin